MRGFLATALLAPALASALVVPNTWDGVDIASPTHTEISHAVHLTLPLITAPHDIVYHNSAGFEVDLAQSGPECGSGDLLINGIPVPFAVIGGIELTEYRGLKSIQMKWALTCGPLTRTLEFAVNSVNGEPINDVGLSVLYSQDDASLEILDIKKFSKNPKPVYVEIEFGLPVPNGAQAPIAEKPSTDDANAIQGIALCDSAKCVFMVAVHNTKETAKHIKSKVKSIFCHGKPREPHPSKYRQSGHHGGKHHDEHDADKHHVRPGHEATPDYHHEEDKQRHHGGDKPHHVRPGHEEATPNYHDEEDNHLHHEEDKHRHHGGGRPHHRVHHGHHGHRGQWHHASKAIHPSLIVFFVLFFAVLMFHVRRRIRRAERAASCGASDCDDGDAPRRRRRCGGWRRRRCGERKREYSEKDEVLPRTEPNPAYSSPSHIATEIADLRHAAEAVEDIVSQSSEGTRYARRGSTDTMETLPEYTADEADSKMGTETLPGYADSEESVSVADGYQPGTGEVWRARVDGVNVKA
ncbi:hypothetical protein V502_02621 [Pseudogymnoascus sp. VKM F-4520 (FW-2644)]|nr:hypothetical protein V502_02621 [Pseudogymnoascus sp. VKM F-4520 (FW-2644)]